LRLKRSTKNKLAERLQQRKRNLRIIVQTAFFLSAKPAQTALPVRRRLVGVGYFGEEMKNSFDAIPGGEEICFVSAPSAGPWSTKEKLENCEF
jgi:hypothetical protein